MSLAPVPLPSLQEDRNQILERVLLNGVSNEHTERAYRRALEKFLAWYDARGYPELSRQVLYDYGTISEDSGAAPSSTNVELAAPVPQSGRGGTGRLGRGSRTDTIS